MGHTPGPWKYWGTEEGYATTVCPQVNTTSRRTRNIPDNERRDNIELMEEEALANARLIAAAPELLEACSLALKFIEAAEQQKILPSTNYAVGYIRETLKAAIAKVE